MGTTTAPSSTGPYEILWWVKNLPLYLRYIIYAIWLPYFPKQKGKIYKTMIRPTTLYGSEYWANKGMNEKQFYAAVVRCNKNEQNQT